MGPGTDVKERIKHGHRPVDYDDYVSMYHDLDYLNSTNISDIYLADAKAISRYDNSLHGYIGSLGLITKDLLLPHDLQSVFLSKPK